MIEAIDQFPNQDLTERGVKNLMKRKTKLGLGAKSRKRKKALIDGWSQQWADELHKPIYNRTFDKWLQDNDIERYSTYNVGKAVVIERRNRTIKCRMRRYLSADNTNVYYYVLPKLVTEYNNDKNSTIKMSPVQVNMKSMKRNCG